MNKQTFEEHVIHGVVDFPVGIYTLHTNEEMLVPIHYHKELELFVLTEGTAKIQLENTSIYLNQKEGVFINSEVLHSAINLENTSCSFIAIVFSPILIALEYDSLYQRFIRPIIKNELIFPIKLPSSAVDLVKETYNLYNKEIFGYELAIKGNITRILSICIANAQKNYNIKNDNIVETVKNVLDYIHINYKNPITLSDLSLQAHTSKEYLCHIFHEISDVSPIVYLNRYRIMQSTYMLRNTNKSISEISLNCGFNNSSYFNKIFMRFMKCTPTEYRYTYKEKVLS